MIIQLYLYYLYIIYITYFSLLYMTDSFSDGCLHVSEPLIINELQISFSQKVLTDIFVRVLEVE